jgi:epoxyqueuosine reductase
MKTLEDNWLKQNQIVDWAYTESSKPISYQKYLDWVKAGYHGPLNYLADERKLKRQNLKEYFPKFQSALVFLFSYIDEKKTLSENSSDLHIASYVTGFEGVDYHHWVKEKLTKIANKFKADDPELEYTFTIDAQPVLERDLAYRSGLGWIGKNSMLISRDHGSYFIIAGLLLNKKLDMKQRDVETDHCGNCTACLDACPTQAILPSVRSVDSSKCISTFTIELFKEADPPEGYTEHKEVYGCDICQEVCPWNKKPLARACTKTGENKIRDFFTGPVESIVSRLEGLSNREFRRQFKNTPLERTGRVGILKNLKPFIDQD